MQITVASARQMANALTVAANEAESKGEMSFELLGTLQAQAQVALDDLQAAIDAKSAAAIPSTVTDSAV